MTSPSVVAHFETLHREMANYNRASEALERERVGAVEKLQELQKQQMIMERASQELSDKVGQFHRQKTMLQIESNRLQTLLQQERMELEECTRREDEMLTEERRKKTDFCRSMAASNDLLGKQLLQQEEQRWMRLIGISSIDLLPTEEAAVVSLKEVTGQWECEDSRKQLLMENIRLLRRKALIKQEVGTFFHHVSWILLLPSPLIYSSRIFVNMTNACDEVAF